MSFINDEEDLLNSIKTFVTNNLNTNIAAINTEKDDDYSIPTITADARHFVIAGELLDLPNNDFVQFALEPDIQIQSNHDDKISIPEITIEVCFNDDKRPGVYFKSLRYMRALYETILTYEKSTLEVGGLQLTKITPMAVTVRGRNLIVSGVTVSIALN